LRNFSAIGEKVNTTARLASEAAAGEIIVSEQAVGAAGLESSQLEARQLKLKGIGEALSVRVMHGSHSDYDADPDLK
jgi:adenylate cyclase